MRGRVETAEYRVAARSFRGAPCPAAEARFACGYFNLSEKFTFI